MKKRLFFSSISLILLAFFMAIPPAFAGDENSLRGRLPDGRAFRTDAQGNQLVDYIAELELSVESLMRRVHGLEYELEEKRNEVARLERANEGRRDERSRRGGLQERDLLSRQDGTFNMRHQRQVSRQDPDVSCPECPNNDWLIEKAVLESRLHSLQEEVESLKVSSPQEELSRQLSMLKSELEATKNQNAVLKTEVIDLRREGQALFDKVSEKRQALEKQEAKLKSARSAVRDRDSRLASLRQEERGAEAGTQESRQSPAAESRSAAAAVSPAPPPHVAALQGRKENLLNEVNRINALISKRNKLFEEYNAGDRAVGFSVSAPVSSRNRTLPQITVGIQRATHQNHLFSLANEIREIRQKVEDDIAMVERMRRLER